MFSGWIYDTLVPYASDLKVAHPAMLRALVVGKRKNDSADAELLADLLRCNLLPQCYMLPSHLRHLRTVLRYRNLIVGEAVRLKNRSASLLMEVGAAYSKRRLHGRAYFNSLMGELDWIPPEVRMLLELTHRQVIDFQRLQQQLINALKREPELVERVELLCSIDGVGAVTALTWALEVGDPNRFRSGARAISYCGLCSGQHQSAGVEHRGPISRKRNKHLQRVLVEAAKLAPRWNAELAELYARQRESGHRNRATIAVARKLVSWLLAVDKRGSAWSRQVAA